jgi:hypothetical protein
MSTGTFARIILALLGVMLALCVLACGVPRFQQAPRPSRRYYHHQQRVHERERRQHFLPVKWHTPACGGPNSAASTSSRRSKTTPLAG